MKKINFIAVILIAILMSCTTTKITSTWKANNVVPKHYNKILVLGLIRDADRSLQEKMETHLVNDLKDMGYNAVSSLSEYGPERKKLYTRTYLLFSLWFLLQPFLGLLRNLEPQNL